MAWIPIEHDHWTVDAMIELLGRERAIQCWRDSVCDLLERPFLRGFVAATLKVIGHSPVSIVRLFAKGWTLVYRDLCVPTLIASTDGQPVIRFEDIAPVVRKYPNYLDSWNGACQGFSDVARVSGNITFDVAPDTSWAEAKFFWEEPAVARGAAPRRR